MVFKLLPVFGRGKEEETLALIQELMKEIETVNNIFRDIVKYWLDDDYDTVYEKAKLIKKAEQKADDINQEIITKLYTGTFLPSTRTELHNLVRNLDKVIDNIWHTVDMFEFTDKKKFREEVKAEFWRLGDKARLSVEKMILVLEDLINDNENIMDHIKEAKDFEQQCDVIKKIILEQLYLGKKEAVTNTLLAQIACNMSSVADSVKVVCNLVLVLKLQKRT